MIDTKLSFINNKSNINITSIFYSFSIWVFWHIWKVSYFFSALFSESPTLCWSIIHLKKQRNMIAIQKFKTIFFLLNNTKIALFLSQRNHIDCSFLPFGFQTRNSFFLAVISASTFCCWQTNSKFLFILLRTLYDSLRTFLWQFLWHYALLLCMCMLLDVSFRYQFCCKNCSENSMIDGVWERTLPDEIMYYAYSMQKFSQNRLQNVLC